MSRTRVLTRLGVTMAAASAVLWPSTAAFAASPVAASIGNLSSAIVAGAPAEGFQVTMQNRTRNEITSIRRVLVLRASGLSVAHIRGVTISAQPLSVQQGASGEVRAVDSQLVRLGPSGKDGDDLRTEYTIELDASAPATRTEVIFQAYRESQLLGFTVKTIAVKPGKSSPTPSVSASATPSLAPTSGPAIVPVDAGPPVAPLESPQAAGGDKEGGGIPAILYILGTVLVAMGGAILWVLIRQRPAPAGAPDHPTAAYRPVPRHAFGHPVPPSPPSNTTPTATMPTIGQPPPAGPGHTAPGMAGPGTAGPGAGRPPVRPTTPPPADPWSTPS